MRKKLLAGLATFLLAVVLVVPVTAAVKPSGISIKGKKTVTVGKTIELDSVITPKKAKVKDRNIIWSSSKPSVAKVLENKDDDTEIKGMKAGTATITVKIKGTKLKGTYKVTVKKAQKSSSGASADKKKIAAYKADAKALKKKISKVKLASTRKERKKQYRKYEKQIDAIEKKLDKIEDKWEDKWEDGKISRSAYRSMERSVELAEDYLDTVEEYLEEKCDYEFDD